MFPLSSVKSAWLLLLIHVCIYLAQQNSSRSKNYTCPTGCQCKRRKQEPNVTAIVGVKVKCDFNKYNLSSMSHLTKSFIRNLPNNTIELDLSSNQITGWDEGLFSGFDHLLRLNLSLNPISELIQDAFQGLDSLKTLDLSHTRISELTNGSFSGLHNLERLIFLETPIKSIHEDSFREMKSINRLDIQSEILTCDCRLGWFSSWLKGRPSIQEDILCGLPSELKGLRVNNLESDVLHCDWPLELSHFELIPSTNQVVFEGDSLPITCQATFFDPSMNFSWLHDGQSVGTPEKKDNFDNVKVILSSERNIKYATLELYDVDESLSGIWTCRIGSGEAHVSKSLKIMVLSRAVIYCPSSKTFDNKGNYGWSSTLAGAVKALPCVAFTDYSGIQNQEVMKAYRACNQDGSWSEPDTSRCPYVSEVTRMLEETASLNLSLPDVTTDNVLKMFHSIGPQTSYGSTIHDHAEICFLAKIVEQLSIHSKKFEKVAGEVVVGLVNLSMNVSPNVLLQAQLMSGCCSRILKALENTIANLLLSNSSHLTFTSRNVAVQGHKMTLKNVAGIACGSEFLAKNESSNVSLVCEKTHSETFNMEDFQEFQSTIFIPPSNVSSSIHHFNNNNKLNNYNNDDNINEVVEEDEKRGTSQVAIIIINLRDSRLFPVLEETSGGDSDSVSSFSKHDDDGGGGGNIEMFAGPVFLANIVSLGQSLNSSSPPPSSVVLTIKNPARKVTLIQVKWKELQNGRGEWSKGYCKPDADASKVHEFHGNEDYADDDDDDDGSQHHKVVKFTCQSLGAYAVTMKPSLHPILTQLVRGLKEVSVLVYIGCLVIFLVSTVIIIIYITHWRDIEMSHKTCHAVVNLNLSLALLAASFALGVKMYRLDVACRFSTIVLHYFSISTQVWITIINFKLLHKLTRGRQEEPLDLDKQKPKVKPIASEYLLGWGVPAIVSGIGSAISWDDQSLGGAAVESKICFLNMSATILMLFLPSAIIIFINFVIFIKVARFLRRGCSYPDDDPDDDENHQNSLKCGTPPSSSASSSSYPPFSSHPARSRSGDTMVITNNDYDDQRFSKHLEETDRRLLQLLNKSVVGVSSGNTSSFVRDATEKSLVPLDGSPFASEQLGERIKFTGFGTIYPPSSQLCGSAATLLLYCATCATGMFSVIGDPPRVFSWGFSGDFFRIMFVALSLALSSFMVVYFCFGRRDIRKAICRKCGCWKKRHQSFSGMASREEVWRLRDSIIEQNKAMDHHPVFYQPEHSTDSFEVELIGFNKRVEDHKYIACGKTCDKKNICELASIMKNTDSSEMCGYNRTDEEEVVPNVAKNSVFVDSRSSIVFYDPRQNGAAKRYWEKARKKSNRSHQPNHQVDASDDAGGDSNNVCSRNRDRGFQRYFPVKQLQQKSSSPQPASDICQQLPTSTDHLFDNCSENKYYGNCKNNTQRLQCFFNNSILSDNVLLSTECGRRGNDDGRRGNDDGRRGDVDGRRGNDDGESHPRQMFEGWTSHCHSFHEDPGFEGGLEYDRTHKGDRNCKEDDEDDYEEEEDDDVINLNINELHQYPQSCHQKPAFTSLNPHNNHHGDSTKLCQNCHGNKSFIQFLPHQTNVNGHVNRCIHSDLASTGNETSSCYRKFETSNPASIQTTDTSMYLHHPHLQCGDTCATQSMVNVWVKK